MPPANNDIIELRTTMQELIVLEQGECQKNYIVSNVEDIYN